MSYLHCATCNRAYNTARSAHCPSCGPAVRTVAEGSGPIRMDMGRLDLAAATSALTRALAGANDLERAAVMRALSTALARVTHQATYAVPKARKRDRVWNAIALGIDQVRTRLLQV